MNSFNYDLILQMSSLLVGQTDYGKPAHDKLAHMVNRHMANRLWQTGTWQNVIFLIKDKVGLFIYDFEENLAS